MFSKFLIVFSVLLALSVFLPGPVIAEPTTETIVGDVNEQYQIVTKDGTIYEIADTELDEEVLKFIGAVFMSRTELLNRIATLLGGRAAEEITLNDVSTGAHNDLSRATDIARSMVKEYGMSEKVGQVYFAREKRSRFLNMGPEGAVEYSEATAELIDGEVSAIISEQYTKVKDILIHRKDVLEKGAKLLLEQEKIEGEDIKALMIG